MYPVAARTAVMSFLVRFVLALGFLCLFEYGCRPTLDEPGSELADGSVGNVEDAASPPSTRDRYVPPPPPPPRGKLEDGWEWWTDYVSSCPIQIPTSSVAMPPPLAWESCPANEFNRGLGCRSLVHPEGGRFYVAFRETGVRRGAPRLSLKWQTADQAVQTSFITEPDGPILFAAQTPLTCGISGTYVKNDRLTFALYSNTVGKEYGRALATIGEKPRLTETISAEHIRPSLEPSSIGAIRLENKVEVLDWTTLTPRTLVAPEGTEATYQPGNLLDLGIDGRILVEAGTRMHLRSYAYALDKEPIDLFGLGLTEGHGIVEIVTDGVDVAWVERYYPDPSSYLPHAAAAYTAPFSLDPTTLVATRKSLPVQPEQAAGSHSGALGCGRWARVVQQQYETAAGGPVDWYGLELFRLSDGHRWFFPSNTAWVWGDVLGMTCDEMFVVVHRNDVTGVPLFELTRIRLDTLPE